MIEKSVENYKSYPDEELISRINQGNYEHMAIIIERYAPVIHSYINKYCLETQREDAAQEANLALFFAIKAFDGTKSCFSTFANLCIKRAILDVLKSGKRQKNIPEEMLHSIDDVELVDANSPEKIFFEREDFKSLTDNIKLELSNLEYNVLRLRLSGESYENIAHSLAISEKTVDNALLRIRKKLRSK